MTDRLRAVLQQKGEQDGAPGLCKPSKLLLALTAPPPPSAPAAVSALMALEAEAAGAPLGSFLRDFPSALGPGEPLPWSSAGSGAVSEAEAPGALAELARNLLGGR